MMDPAQSQALLCMRGRLKNKYISHVRKLTKLLLLLRLKKKKGLYQLSWNLSGSRSAHMSSSAIPLPPFFFLRSDRLFFIKKKGVAIRPSLHDYKAAARSQSLFRTHGSINESRVFFHMVYVPSPSRAAANSIPLSKVPCKNPECGYNLAAHSVGINMA
jgi:hypothetical protein